MTPYIHPPQDRYLALSNDRYLILSMVDIMVARVISYLLYTPFTCVIKVLYPHHRYLMYVVIDTLTYPYQITKIFPDIPYINHY